MDIEAPELFAAAPPVEPFKDLRGGAAQNPILTIMYVDAARAHSCTGAGRR